VMLELFVEIRYSGNVWTEMFDFCVKPALVTSQYLVLIMKLFVLVHPK